MKSLIKLKKVIMVWSYYYLARIMRVKDNWLHNVLQNALVSLCDQVLYELGNLNFFLIRYFCAIRNYGVKNTTNQNQ